MSRKKSMTVKITAEVWIDDRRVLPGETVTVPADKAREWIETQRAVNVAAEVEYDEG